MAENNGNKPLDVVKLTYAVALVGLLLLVVIFFLIVCFLRRVFDDSLLVTVLILLLIVKFLITQRKEKILQHNMEVRRTSPTTPNVTIIGAGFSGLCAGIKLQQAGIPFRIFEKEEDVGGTWFLNKYPGVACDVPAHGYSFSFELNPFWTHGFACGNEIENYIRSVARKYNLYSHCTFGTEVVSAVYDVAEHNWIVSFSTRGSPVQVIRSRILMSCVGGLHVPSYPSVPGVQSGIFQGQEVHSACWTIQEEEWKKDWKDKSVVVVGSAASAVQIVPSIAPHVGSLTIIQRTPNWLSPQRGVGLPPDLNYSRFFQSLLSLVPGALRLYRAIIYLSMEMYHYPLQVFSRDSRGQVLSRTALRDFMKAQLKGRVDLEEKVIPTFPVGCKRIIRSERFLPTLLLPHVTLVASSLSSVGCDGVVVKSGEQIPADVIIYATGFEVGSMGRLRLMNENHVVGGRDLLEVPGRSASYLGLVTPDFPNCFFLLGPNTGLGHQSIIFMIECQVAYAVQVIALMADQNIKEIRIRQEKVNGFMKEVQEGFVNSVWTAPGCRSWYQNRSGEVPTLWPYNTVRYMRKTSPPINLDDYECISL